MSAYDVFDDPDYWGYDSGLWQPWQAHGWTWIRTSECAPEGYSLLDADGELWGHVYNRWDRVICWAPFIWAEEAYRSEEDVGEFGFEDDAQRQRHLARIGPALSEWVAGKRAAGVSLELLRDTHAYYYETGNGHGPETLEEFDHGRDSTGFRTLVKPHEEESLALSIGDWRAVPQTRWCCEGYRLRDATGRLRGQVQLRYGVVRAVAAQRGDAERLDPMVDVDEAYRRRRQTCRGQIVLQESLGRRMAISFEPGEREAWLERAVAAIEATPDPDRAWRLETLGAWGTPEQKMFPASRRE